MEILHLDDVLCRLRSTGKNMFEEQFKVQKKQMLDIIKDSGKLIYRFFREFDRVLKVCKVYMC